MISIIPKDATFFRMFAEMSDNLIAGARILVDLFGNYRDVQQRIGELHRIEHAGDDLTHKILTRLNQTFITPLDREDIHQLAASLDDVLDFIYAAGARLVMYRISSPPSAAGDLANIILLQCRELQSGVSLLQRKNGNVLAHCVEINRLENEADQVSQQAIAKLFDGEKDPITLLKTKELLEFLERATDKAEDVANVLETVVLKNT